MERIYPVNKTPIQSQKIIVTNKILLTLSRFFTYFVLIDRLLKTSCKIEESYWILLIKLVITVSLPETFISKENVFFLTVC